MRSVRRCRRPAPRPLAPVVRAAQPPLRVHRPFRAPMSPWVVSGRPTRPRRARARATPLVCSAPQRRRAAGAPPSPSRSTYPALKRFAPGHACQRGAVRRAPGPRLGAQGADARRDAPDGEKDFGAVSRVDSHPNPPAAANAAPHAANLHEGVVVSLGTRARRAGRARACPAASRTRRRPTPRREEECHCKGRPTFIFTVKVLTA